MTVKVMIGVTIWLFIVLALARVWIAKRENYWENRRTIRNMLRELERLGRDGQSDR